MHPFLAQQPLTGLNRKAFRPTDYSLDSSFEYLAYLGFPDIIQKMYDHWKKSPIDS